MRSGFVTFVARYVWALLRAASGVAAIVLRPGRVERPAVVLFETRARTDIEVTTIANLISFTPGTIAADVSEDGRTLRVHVMELPPAGADAVREEIREVIEDPFLEFLRPKAGR